MTRQTHTYVILELSKEAVDEISGKLREAGYDHAFHDDVVDMHGIAVTYKAEDKHPWRPIYPGATVHECASCGIQRLSTLWRRVLVPGLNTTTEWFANEFPACTGERGAGGAR